MADFGSDSDDSEGEGGLGNVTRAIMRPPGHSGKAKRGHLCFDASFETGNLGRVELINDFEYDLYLRPDTCNPRFRFWFHFTVDNVRLEQKVIFNVVNMSKGRNLFGEQLTPLTKSTSKPKWQRMPKSLVFYHRSPIHRNNYVLSFAYAFDKEDEVYHFALGHPYSYSRLQAFLEQAKHSRVRLRREQLCLSLQKRSLDLLTIDGTGDADDGAAEGADAKRPVVVITARSHPADAPASFACQGIIELLLSPQPLAAKLRRHVAFKIVPMLNPDGVFLGNNKCNLMGQDLNRAWNRASPFLHPTIAATAKMVADLDKGKEGTRLDLVIDLHADSTLKGCFMHGNAYDDVYRYERHIVFPKIVAAHTEDFVTASTIYNADPIKAGAARRHLCNLLSDRVNCYSFVVSSAGYDSADSGAYVPYTEEGCILKTVMTSG